MTLGVRHKIASVFLILIVLDVLMGVGVHLTVRRYREVVKGVIEAGWQIRYAKGIQNNVREETLLLLAMSGESTRTRARALISEVHLRIQADLERMTDDPDLARQLGDQYQAYWELLNGGFALASTSDQSEAKLEPYVRDLMGGAVNEIEATVIAILERNIRRISMLDAEIAGKLRYFRVLRLPDSYFKAQEALSIGFDHIYVYDEMWADLMRLQLHSFGARFWPDSSDPTLIPQIVSNLDLWLNTELRGGAALDALERFRNEEVFLYGQVRAWVKGYGERLAQCDASAQRDFRVCFLDGFERIREIHRRMIDHSLAEARHVEENMAVASESIGAVASSYTVISLGFAFIAGILAVYIFREIITPVRRLRQGFELMADGRFSYRIQDRRTDEFGQLQMGFNRMADAIEKRDHDLMAVRIDLENLAFKIQNTSEDLEQEVRRRTSQLVQAYEEVKKNDRLKSEFIANMSHELRTPLNSIIGFSKVILKGIDGPVTDRQKEDLVLIHQSGKHLLDLISQILDFSKIEAGKFDLRKEPVNVCDLAGEAILTAKALVRDKPVRLGFDAADNVPLIEADRTRLMQVLINLLGNAVKFTEHGAVRLQVRRWSASDPESPDEPVAFDWGVLVSVSDTGIGIPEASREAVFQKFQQVDGSSTRAFGGTGLGLAITRELVQMHGGYIWFKSRMGEGTTFFVLLPEGNPAKPAA